MFYESKRQAEVVMGQIRNTRKIYFLNYNKLRLLLILVCICTTMVLVPLKSTAAPSSEDAVAAGRRASYLKRY